METMELERPVSSCCAIDAGEFEDVGICPLCKEHCCWIEEGEEDE